MPWRVSSSMLARLKGSGIAFPGRNAARFLFAIPLKPKANAARWDLVSDNLARTIRSVEGATNGAYRIYLCGHERPDVDLTDGRITFLAAGFAHGQGIEQASADKARKLCRIGSALKAAGYDDVYVMFLDADDLVHRDLVAHVLAADNRRSHLIRHGYVYDASTSRLALREDNFDRACGSSFVGWFENRDLPSNDEDRKSYFQRFAPHRRREAVAGAKGRAPDTVPFAAIVYQINHAESLQSEMRGEAMRGFSLRRALPAAAAREILARDFSFEMPPTP